MAEHTFIVYGQPSPYAVYARNMGRPPPGFGKMQAWQEQIQLQLRVAYKGEPHTGPVVLDTEFHMAPTKGGQSKKKPESYTRWCIEHMMKRPDLDNLRKAASDACQGILFVNDSQVAWGKMRKVFIDKFTEAEPYTVIRFTPVLPVVLDLEFRLYNRTGEDKDGHIHNHYPLSLHLQKDQDRPLRQHLHYRVVSLRLVYPL